MVTIHDIARELGIAPSTVSRALSGSLLINKKTREQIEAKAKELGYVRNMIASNLRKGVTNTVAIIVPRINRQFFANVISGAQSVLNKAGFSVIICQTSEYLEAEIQALKTTMHNQVAGVLISHSIESTESKHITEILGNNVRLVQFDRIYSDLPGAKVVNDNFNGAYKATEHLIRKGYKRIGTLAGYKSVEHYVERIEGYKKALTDNGLQIDESIIYPNAILRETGYENAVSAIKNGCDALYCAGDFSALGALDAAKEAGMSVPEQFGIVGTANEIFTSLTHPSLSTIEMRPVEIGKAAATAFLEGSNEKITIKMELIERESSNKTI